MDEAGFGPSALMRAPKPAMALSDGFVGGEGSHAALYYGSVHVIPV